MINIINCSIVGGLSFATMRMKDLEARNIPDSNIGMACESCNNNHNILSGQ
jgi:hypothetical protein